MDSQLAEQLTIIFPDKVIPDNIQQFYRKIEDHHILDDISAYSVLYQDKEKLKKLLNLHGFSCNWPTKAINHMGHKQGVEASLAKGNASVVNLGAGNQSKHLRILRLGMMTLILMIFWSPKSFPRACNRMLI